MNDLQSAIQAVQRGELSKTAAAESIGMPRTTFRSHFDRQLGSPGFVPDGYQVKGTSILYDQDGEKKLEWVKTSVDAERQQEMFAEALNAMKAELPRLSPIARPTASMPDLANLYVITDYHMGALAWHKEGGANWDIKIAKRTLIGCFEQMLATAPNSSKGIICQLGDFLHSDGIMPVTPTSGHLLDQDGRFTKVVRASIEVLRAIVDMALTKHDTVHVIMAEGNHDISSSIWLREMFSALYENEPRVTIDNSEIPYYVHQHGETMLAFHHGHLKKFSALTGLFAAQFPKIWGNTKYRYGHTGHFHHTQQKEDMGMVMTQHQTLAAKDAYSARGGYYANRSAQCVTYHKEHGQVATNNVTPEMIL